MSAIAKQKHQVPVYSLEQGLARSSSLIEEKKDIQDKPIVVAIAGGSGSGKTYAVANQLKNSLKSKSAVIQMDDYYYGLTCFSKQQKDEINWDAVFERASEWGCARCVYLTLKMTEELLGVSLPGKVKQQIEAENITSQIISGTGNLFSTPTVGGSELTPI